MAKKNKEELTEEPIIETANIEDLPGVGAATAEKLRTAGFSDLISIAVSSPGELVEIAGVTEATARKMIQFARAELNLGFESGEEVLKRREKVIKLTTGSKAFDNLLGGGFETGAIVECFGAYGSGKCVDKNTKVLYFNPSTAHLETIEETYNKYKEINGEHSYDSGYIVPVHSVRVLGLTKQGIRKTKASFIYKEKVKKICEVTTRRGRKFCISYPHKLLSFDNGLVWKPASQLERGAIIACPKQLEFESATGLSEEDAYFLGLFAAEGTSNPLSITNSSKKLVDWMNEYINEKDCYLPTIRTDKRRTTPLYIILLRNNTKERLGKLSKSNAQTKFVPEEVLSGSKKIAAQFLAGYLDGDGYLSKRELEVCSKSQELISGVSYLFLKLGIQVTKSEKYVRDSEFHMLRVVGEDKEKLNSLPLKIKKAEYKSRNSSYGYPKPINSYLQKVYKEILGGNRRVKKKYRKARFYQYLTHTRECERNMNSATFNALRIMFFDELYNIQKTIEDVRGCCFGAEELTGLKKAFPFAYNILAKTLKLTKSGVRNYLYRGVPKARKEEFRKKLINTLTHKESMLEIMLKTMKNISQLNWDEVTGIREKEYNDYVYDFVVPEGHSFVGGDIPTVMHNTQLGHVLSVNCQKQEEGVVAVYIDTENTFRPERIIQLAEGAGLDPKKVLQNIRVARAFNSDHQMLLAEKVEDLIKKQGLKVRLVVVDSLTAHFRAEFLGRGTLAVRQQKLNKHMHALLKLADQHNLCVYVTNQVMARPDVFFGDPTEAIGGNIVAHNCLTADTLIQLGNGDITPIGDVYELGDVISVNLKTDLKNSRKRCEMCAVKTRVNTVCEITTTTSKIKTSPEHRFFKIKDFEVVEARAKELNAGDYIMQSRKINVIGKLQKLPAIKVDEMVTVKSGGAELIKEDLIKRSVKRAEVCKDLQITPRQLRRVLNQGYPTNVTNFELLIQQGINPQVLQLVEPHISYRHRQITMPQYLTEKVAQIVGYVYGDGNIGRRDIRLRDERLEVLESYKQLFGNVFNVEGKLSKLKNKSCYQLSINSKEISGLFKEIKGKTLKLIATSPNEQVKAFVRGFFDAEGFVDKKRVIASMSQRDERTLQYIQLLLLRFGIRSKLRSYIYNKNPISQLDILDKESYLRFVEEIGTTAKDKKQLMQMWSTYLRNTYSKEVVPISRQNVLRFLKECRISPSTIITPRSKDYKHITTREAIKVINALEGKKLTKEQTKKLNFLKKILASDVRWEKVKKIEARENKEPLYDLSIAENENFIANGFIVHNSVFRVYLRRGKKGSRVAKLIDSPNLPDGEANFYVKQEGLNDID